MEEVAVSVVLCPLQIVAELPLMETVGVGFTVTLYVVKVVFVHPLALVTVIV